jgi:hypothetical protein
VPKDGAYSTAAAIKNAPELEDSVLLFCLHI